MGGSQAFRNSKNIHIPHFNISSARPHFTQEFKCVFVNVNFDVFLFLWSELAKCEFVNVIHISILIDLNLLKEKFPTNIRFCFRKPKHLNRWPSLPSFHFWALPMWNRSHQIVVKNLRIEICRIRYALGDFTVHDLYHQYFKVKGGGYVENVLERARTVSVGACK